ncbi:MAG TPA: single-stranded DNA-binding protein [Spirochaetota bacterium]|nr:single-stranded DNA-binding protein [Spirochaetota bacterium]HPJ33699.1 single-stranded DNA-binding protein [Spirochaetota bacterium]
MGSISLSGHIIDGPEIARERNSMTCTFTVSGKEKDAAEAEKHFFKCRARGKIAEALSESLKAGMDFYITGDFAAEKYSDSNKNSIYDNIVTVNGFFNSDIGHITA